MATKTTIDGTISIDLPEGFVVMKKSDVQNAFSLDYEDLWGARDEKRHVMLATIWKDAPLLLGKLVTTKALIERAENALRKTYAKSDYRLDAFYDAEIAGTKAEGFAYDFTVNGVKQQGEVIIFRLGKRTYTLYYYERPEDAAGNRELRADLLRSIG